MQKAFPTTSNVIIELQLLIVDIQKGVVFALRING